MATGDEEYRLVGRDFERLGVIGSGGFSVVYKGRQRSTGKLVALKVLKDVNKVPEKVERSLHSEAQKLAKMKHVNIIPLVGAILEVNNYALVTDYMPHGNLHDFLDANQGHISMTMKTKIVDDIISGMVYLHTRPPRAVLHLDLKSQNVLVDEDLTAKLSDFGLSCWEHATATYSTRRSDQKAVGTITHISPEWWGDINLKPDSKQDVYSFGILMWEILTCKVPFTNVRVSELIRMAVERGQRPSVDELPADTPTYLCEMMEKCWSQEPSERPSFTSLKETLVAREGPNFERRCSAAVEQLVPSLKTDSPQVHGQTVEMDMGVIVEELLEEDTAMPAQTGTTVDQPPSGANLDLQGRNVDVRAHPGDRAHGHAPPHAAVIRTNPALPIQRNTTERIHPAKAFAGGGQPLDRYGANVGDVVHRAALADSACAANRGQDGGHEQVDSSLEVDASPSNNVLITKKGTQASGGGPGSGSSPDNSKPGSGGKASKPQSQKKPVNITHQHASGSRTVITASGDCNNIQIGDHNMMHVYTGNARAPSGPVRGKKIGPTTTVIIHVTESTRIIDDEDIGAVAPSIGNKWRKLGRRLGFSDGQLDNYNHDFKFEGLEEVVRQVLVGWRSVHGANATAKKLGDALCDIDCLLVAGKLK